MVGRTKEIAEGGQGRGNDSKRVEEIVESEISVNRVENENGESNQNDGDETRGA